MTTSALDPIILAAFGPPPANVDLGETRENRNNGAVIAMLVLATVALVLRFLARIMQRAGLQYDDWTIIVALVGGLSRMDRHCSHQLTRHTNSYS